MKFITQNIFLLITALLLTACAQLEKKAEALKPTATLTATRLANINFEQADLIFDVEIENQNPVSINLAGLDYDLKIENQSLISGVAAKGLKIDASSTSKVELPLTLKFDDLKKLPGKLWERDRFAYQLDTKTVVDLPIIGHYEIPLSKTGELPVPKLPNVKLKDVKISSLSFKGAEIVAEVEVDNPNAFDLGFSDFNYQLNINKQSWGKGKLQQKNIVPMNGSAIIKVPLSLDLLSIGQSAYKTLLNKEPFEYQLKGGITLDTGIELLRDYKMPLDITGKASLN